MSVPENGTIIVHPGIYREELVIKKQVTIIGTGKQSSPEMSGLNSARRNTKTK